MLIESSHYPFPRETKETTVKSYFVALLLGASLLARAEGPPSPPAAPYAPPPYSPSASAPKFGVQVSDPEFFNKKNEAPPPATTKGTMSGTDRYYDDAERQIHSGQRQQFIEECTGPDGLIDKACFNKKVKAVRDGLNKKIQDRDAEMNSPLKNVAPRNNSGQNSEPAFDPTR